MTPAYYKGLIESCVDKIGLANFLELVEEVCYEKAEHVRANWQDYHLARIWDRAGSKVGKAKCEAVPLGDVRVS